MGCSRTVQCVKNTFLYFLAGGTFTKDLREFPVERVGGGEGRYDSFIATFHISGKPIQVNPDNKRGWRRRKREKKRNPENPIRGRTDRAVRFYIRRAEKMVKKRKGGKRNRLDSGFSHVNAQNLWKKVERVVWGKYVVGWRWESRNMKLEN